MRAVSVLVVALFVPLGIADPVQEPDLDQFIQAAHAIGNLTIEYAKATGNGTSQANATNDYVQGVVLVIQDLPVLDDLDGYLCYRFEGTGVIEGAYRYHTNLEEAEFTIGVAGPGYEPPNHFSGYHWFSTKTKNTRTCLVNGGLLADGEKVIR